MREEVLSRRPILRVPVEVLVIKQRTQSSAAVVCLLPFLVLVMFMVLLVVRRQFQRTRQGIDGVGQVVAVRLDAVQFIEDEIRIRLQKRKRSRVSQLQLRKMG
ncbi:hypothetical protein TNIN_351581 [Trichonephila inaurata madagascariensis]|uniref:Transmembrane protein n=1 Tax=Trichonephila inaurata madagascariensis TaxID=2747483 RepID=A0A8X6MFF1_9ARAC|nr:hypothetical protein TNIN_351581 [Trichonephila inaurata madagascariensis]